MRAALTGLRKAGSAVVREKAGEAADGPIYRLAAGPEAEA